MSYSPVAYVGVLDAYESEEAFKAGDTSYRELEVFTAKEGYDEWANSICSEWETKGYVRISRQVIIRDVRGLEG